jgi:hypothetical protein
MNMGIKQLLALNSHQILVDGIGAERGWMESSRATAIGCAVKHSLFSLPFMRQLMGHAGFSTAAAIVQYIIQTLIASPRTKKGLTFHFRARKAEVICRHE